MKNETIRLDITDLNPDGNGVGRWEGKVVFVPGTAPGDSVTALIVKEQAKCSYARLLSVDAPSPIRQDAGCPVYDRCGGCTLRHITYEAEAKLKQSFVADAMKRIGKSDVRVAETVCGDPERYRNKVQYPFSPSEGKCVFGYYARRSHRVVCHSDCLLQDSIFTEIASFCAESCDMLGISAYDELCGKGELRHAVMRKNRADEIMLCLVVTDPENPKYDLLADSVALRFPSVRSIHLNENKNATNVIFGEKTRLIKGEKTLSDTLCGKRFFLSPNSFYQVNSEMAEKLYYIAGEKAGIKENEVVLDLYCGAGTIGISLCGESNPLCGVEIVKEAVRDARINALENGRTDANTLFVCGDAREGVKRCTERFGKPGVIIVDPPRKGLEQSVIDGIIGCGPERVLYISCNPATLARDCALLSSAGYMPESVTPVDLFPRTGHIESVVLLKKGVMCDERTS